MGQSRESGTLLQLLGKESTYLIPVTPPFGPTSHQFEPVKFDLGRVFDLAHMRNDTVHHPAIAYRAACFPAFTLRSPPFELSCDGSQEQMLHKCSKSLSFLDHRVSRARQSIARDANGVSKRCRTVPDDMHFTAFRAAQDVGPANR